MQTLWTLMDAESLLYPVTSCSVDPRDACRTILRKRLAEEEKDSLANSSTAEASRG